MPTKAYPWFLGGMMTTSCRQKRWQAQAALAAGILGFQFICGAAKTDAYFTNQSATVVIGQPDMNSNEANNGGVGPNSHRYPWSVSSDNTRLFIADTNNHRILIYNTIPASSNAPANVVVGQPDMSGSQSNQGGAAGANTLSYPCGAFSDGTKLYVADTNNHRVLIFNTIPAANNASADVVVGQPDMGSNAANQGGSVADITLDTPYKVIASGSTMLVADMYNHRVLIYDGIPTTNNMPADLVIGQTDMISSDPGTSNWQLRYPCSICSDGVKLYLADYGNHRVLIYNSVPGIDGEIADVVIGQPDFTSSTPNNGGIAANTLYHPVGVQAYSNRLFISDYDNHRVLIYNNIPTGDFAAAQMVIGQPNPNTNLPNQGAGPQAHTLDNPSDLWAGNAGLWISERNNHRTLFHRDVTPTVTPTATGTATITPTITTTPTTTVIATLTPILTPMPYILPRDRMITYPSPAAGDVLWFYYYVQGPAGVKMEIFNMLGEPCQTLEESIPDAGYHRTRWNIARVAPGIYFCRLTLKYPGGSRTLPVYKLIIVKK
ncbi:hypothetical protein JW933_01060 [candidate division FCPU426 bacterium]|nr:hypothetical protein [candidate division FCPU426 bacterium]